MITEFRRFTGLRAGAFLLPALAVMIFAGHSLHAALVGPAGYANTFSAQPPATDWATLSVAGAPTDTYDSDAEVNALGGVNGTTAQDAGNPPVSNGSAVWSSTGLYLQTRPTGNRGTVLMGKFVNNTGTNATQIVLSYLFTVAASGAAEEIGKGTRAYFSLTGAANSWTNLPALNTTASSAGSSTLNATVFLNWANGGNLFLLWFDDNARDGTDSANQWDNFSLRVTASVPTNAPTAGRVGPAGYTNGFATQPPAAEWSTLSLAGSGTDVYSADAEANASVSASGVAAEIVPDAGNPPGTAPSAVWSSSRHYLQTRPTGNRATVLMGRFVNNTGSNATQIALSYLLTIAAGGAAEDNGGGTRCYFSLTGQANSWTNVPSLNTMESAEGSFPSSASLSLNWTNGGPLFLVWLDDNSSGGTDSANQFNAFSLRVTAATPTNFFCRVLAPESGATLLSGNSVMASALTGSGKAPYTVAYFTNSGSGDTGFGAAGTRTAAPYALSLGNLPVGTHRIYAVSTDSTGVPMSVTSGTNTFSVADPLAFMLTAPANGATFAHTEPVLGVATVAGGTAPYTVQYYFDDRPQGMAISAPPYERNFGGLPVGAHTIRATATDASGWVSNSQVSTVHITGPLAAGLTPPHGTLIPIGNSLSLTAALAGGEAPYAAGFYVNGQLAGSLSTPPFTLNLGALPVGSYTCYVHATDSSVPAQEARSGTNRITVLPRLRVMPLGDSITYGAGGPGGYRAPLYQLLTNLGHTVDFIGTQTGNGAPSLPDPDHEGYPGYTIRNIDALVPGLVGALAEPDIILLLLGVNDYLQNDETAQATNRLEALVERLVTQWPNARVIVGSLTPVSEPRNTLIQTTFNALLPGLCQRQRSLGRSVYFTDMYSAVPLADMPDQLHPNQLGYRKMATNWSAAVNLLACADCPPRFISQPGPQLVLPGASVTLAVEAVGTGPLQYQWRFEGTNILDATNRVYSFANASLANGHGNFSVAVSDEVGTAISSNALVFVRISPGIVVQPTSQTVLQGQSATFTCVATGAPPLFYRWLRDGLAQFTNTTGIGVFTNVHSSAPNGIRCLVANAAGAVASDLVSLLVLADADGDGMEDAWEAQHGFSPNNAADALLDFDGDGMSNRGEYLSGTDPEDPGSVLKLTLTSTEAVALEFVAVSNRTYTIQFQPNLAPGPWNNLTHLNAQSQTRTVRLNAIFSPPLREGYYRLVTPQEP